MNKIKKVKKEKTFKFPVNVIILVVLLRLLNFDERLAIVFIIGIPDHNDRTNAMMHAIVTDTPQFAVTPSLLSTKTPAPHDHSAQTQPLNLQTEPLPHIMVLHDVYLVRKSSLLQRPRQISGFGGGERVEIVLQLFLVLYVGGVFAVDLLLRERAPVGAEEDGSGRHVDEDDGVAGAKVVVDGPADGEGGLVGEVDGNPDLAAGEGGGRWGGGWSGGVGGGVVDLDGGEVGVVGIRLGLLRVHCFSVQCLQTEIEVTMRKRIAIVLEK